jgi:hypothetical protein
MSDDKVRENRLRRMAARQGFALLRSRRRDPRAVDYGLYWVVDESTSVVVAWGSYYENGMDLDEVEEWLQTTPSERWSPLLESGGKPKAKKFAQEKALNH